MTDAEMIFDAYERLGTLRGVARELDIPYATVRRTLQHDLVRMYDAQMGRMERVAEEWSDQERTSLRITQAMMGMLERLVSHIAESWDEGRLTELRDGNLKPYRLLSCVEGEYQYEQVNTRMTPVQALQWLFGTKQPDMVARMGFNAAKVAETFRQLATQSMSGSRDITMAQGRGDEMSSAEILEMMDAMEHQGLTLPTEWVQIRHALQASPS